MMAAAPAVKGKWIGSHAPVADGDQIFDPALGVLDQQVDRIGAIRRWIPRGLSFTRTMVPQFFAAAILSS